MELDSVGGLPYPASRRGPAPIRWLRGPQLNAEAKLLGK